MGTPIARGALAAVVALATGLGLVVVPVLAMQVAAGSAMPVLDALVLALNVLVLGHGGGTVLSTGVVDGGVHLMPLGLTFALGLVCAISCRRAAHALAPVDREGRLRRRALSHLAVAVAAFATVYGFGLGMLAALGRSAELQPVAVSAIASGALVAVVSGGAGAIWAIRREARRRSGSVQLLELLPAPYGALARALAIALLGLLALGLVTVVVMLGLGFGRARALMEGLDPGIVGGAVLTLLQLALLPLLAVWALVVLLGGTITFGAGTSYSLAGATSGVLPALPLLGALPQPGTAPGWTWALLVLPAVPTAVGAVALVRGTAQLARRERIIAWIGYPVALTIAVLLLAGLATGGIGEGRLAHLGPLMDTLALPLLAMTVLATGAVLVALASPLPAWIRQRWSSLRRRVEREEARERAEASGAEAGGAEAGDGSASEQRTDPVQ